MSRFIYHVPSARCTDLEPLPGWYVSSDQHRDIESDGPTGPFPTRADAFEERDAIEAIQDEDEADERAAHGQFGVGA